MSRLLLLWLAACSCILVSGITLPLTGGTNSDPGMVASPRVVLSAFSSSTSSIRAMADIHDRFGTYLIDRAARIGCEAAALAAIVYVESGGNGFSSSGRMIIRFENHVFKPRLNDDVTFAGHYMYDSSSNWLGHYWRAFTADAWSTFHGSQNLEWTVLQFSQDLNDGAALLSASYGAPQIMGFNYASIGYASVQAMFLDFSNSLQAQMDGMISFIKGRSTCLAGLRTNDFTTFASCYNGAGQAAAYGANIQAAYDSYNTVLNTLGVVTPIPCQYGGLYGACGISSCEGQAYSGVAVCGGADACCIDYISCSPSGNVGSGQCIDVSTCASPGVAYSGVCPGGASIKCCVGGPSSAPITASPVSAAPTAAATVACSYQGLSGTCGTSCGSGFKAYTSTSCTGGTSCCAPAQSCTPDAGVTSGLCVDVSVYCVGGVSYSGLCPGNAAIKCCAGTSTPSRQPTGIPTMTPTIIPSKTPTTIPSSQPTGIPTRSPTGNPTRTPTFLPTRTPTGIPTGAPTLLPTRTPTFLPTREPTKAPTAEISCTPDGGYNSGVCKDVSLCVGTTFAGFCPGSAFVQCCVPNPFKTRVPSMTPTSRPSLVPTRTPTNAPIIACIYEGLNGFCSSSGSLCGSGYHGYAGVTVCGSAANVCCASAQTCSSSGSCLNVAVCPTGSTIMSGLCPGSTNIKCCIPISAADSSAGAVNSNVATGVTVPVALFGLAAVAFVVIRRRSNSSSVTLSWWGWGQHIDRAIEIDAANGSSYSNKGLVANRAGGEEMDSANPGFRA